MECPDCNGIGKIHSPFSRVVRFECDYCDGTGQINEEKIEMRKKGHKFRDIRMSKRVNLRQFALDTGLSAVKIMRMERGIEPLDEKLYENIKEVFWKKQADEHTS